MKGNTHQGYILISRGGADKSDLERAETLKFPVDSSNEYAVFVNENKYDGDLNSIKRVYDFLRLKYLHPGTVKPRQVIYTPVYKPKPWGIFQTNKGEIKVELNFEGAVPALSLIHI